VDEDINLAIVLLDALGDLGDGEAVEARVALVVLCRVQWDGGACARRVRRDQGSRRAHPAKSLL